MVFGIGPGRYIGRGCIRSVGWNHLSNQDFRKLMAGDMVILYLTPCVEVGADADAVVLVR